MRVVLTGATGMVGSGVLLECLDDERVDAVLSVSRRPSGLVHHKLEELIVDDMSDLSEVADRLQDIGACFFYSGVSAAGMSEAEYHRVTYDLTLHVAETLLEANPNMVFCYVSGAGTDSSEKGRIMWARVKGKIENKLLAMPFKAAWMFRPGYIQPMKGVRSKTPLYNAIYTILGPLYPAFRRIAPNQVTTTEKVGCAMINVVLTGEQQTLLENRDINRLAEL